MVKSQQSIPLRLSFGTASVEEAERFLSDSYAPLKLTPYRRGPIDVRLKAVVSNGLTVFATNGPTGIHFETRSAFDGYHLTIPLNGGLEVAERACKIARQACNGSALMVDSQQVRHGSFVAAPSAGLSRWDSIVMTSDAMHASLAELLDAPVRNRLRFGDALPAQSGALRSIQMLTNAFLQGMEGDAPLVSAPSAMVSLRDTLVKLILETVPHSYSQQLLRHSGGGLSPAHVRRAIEFMVAHAADPISVADIAKASHTSSRTLQTAFRNFKDTTPMAYLRQLRLSRARADLLDPAQPASVSQIALRWGFFQPGSFAVCYRVAFGESPSVTLKQR